MHPLLSSLLALGLAATVLFRPESALAHGSLESGRMLQVRLAGPNGQTPCPWNDSFYTWNQNSHNFPNYADPNFRYADVVPDGRIANAGVNDGVQSSLNFSGLNNPGPGWTLLPATAGGAPVRLHFLATAGHDPSHFQVYLTRPGVNPNLRPLAWSDLEHLGRWAEGDAVRPVTKSTRTNPVTGGPSLSYDWDVTVPADRGAGPAVLLVIWQRDDPAGEAFFAVLDLQVTVPAAVPPTPPQLSATRQPDATVTLHLRQAVPGRTYDLEATTSLAAPATWTVLDTGAADGSGVWQTADPDAPDHPQRFYRVVPRP